MTLTVIDGAGLDIEEPDWDALIPNAGRSKAGDNSRWRAVAGQEWRRVTAAMRAAGTLGPENRHQLQRLVLSYVRYDIAAAKMFQGGAVVKSPRTKVPMHSLWQAEMRQADEAATKAEVELGIPPRRRGGATAAKRNTKKRTAAHDFLASR
ncbi:phage terminase small subunit [Azospirillum sp. OGB3]|uniref:P27 family phage terminase small subunit n=1 Tax=Azospirillum sp. OGB3 TaxID=2587012 RepID=UPI0016063CB4|nr:P27 family phage terminase small subunit [Azospirillum sp. OGB3]MBB3264046.1 phage terminase small subunit [Azospirillum sp. OGB3]